MKSDESFFLTLLVTRDFLAHWEFRKNNTQNFAFEPASSSSNLLSMHSKSFFFALCARPLRTFFVVWVDKVYLLNFFFSPVRVQISGRKVYSRILSTERENWSYNRVGVYQSVDLGSCKSNFGGWKKSFSEWIFSWCSVGGRLSVTMRMRFMWLKTF